MQRTHEVFGEAVQTQTGRASLLLIGTFMGGMLILASYIAKALFPEYTHARAGGREVNDLADLLAAVGAILLGAPLVIHAIRSLARGHLHMDELAALAVVAAFATAEYQAAGIVAFFMLLSELIETRTALGARASIESLVRLAPRRARRLADGQEQEVDAAQLRPGDLVRVLPGDDVPADGEVLSGQTTINQANITGESLPVDKGAGDEVFGGTTNITGAIEIRVSRAGPDTTLGRVQQLILQAEQTRIPLMRLMDQYAGWYTPLVLMLAGIVLFFTREPNRAIGMLVIACPCAIILATPTAIVAALSAAARLGVLIKDVANLEWARKLTAIVLDKTGTLTTGELAVTRLMPAEGVEGKSLLLDAASIERLSRHPIARAVVAVAEQAGLDLPQAGEFAETPGRGVKGLVNGMSVMVGRRTWLAEQGVDFSAIEGEQFAEPEGLSILHVARGGRCIGWIGLEDRTRPEAKHAMSELEKLGIRHLVMVTGDRRSVARRVGREMGCTEVVAEVLPAQKLALVDDLKAKGHRVAVVGDGVNDAPALAAGDLGIAMGAAGSDVAINSASIALMNNDLSRLPFLVRLSRATTGVIWQNLAFGLLYIVAGLAATGMGWITLEAAAVLHTLSSAIVVFNSARLVRHGEHLATVRPAVPRRAEPASVPPPQAEAVRTPG